MVFAGEVVLVVFILVMTSKVGDALREGPKLSLDFVGTVLSASALGVIVLGTLAVEHLGVDPTQGLARSSPSASR